jgi:NhaP-type Na+/H+ or K+/H+ antiporter
MGEPNEPRPRKSVLGWCVLGGSVALALAGAIAPQPSDLNIVTGAIYGLVLGVIAGVLLDRLRGRG